MSLVFKARTHDTLDRRLRWARPQSTGMRIAPQEADYQILEALDCHGPLPATYLYEFVKPLRSNYTGHQKRLCQLYNEANTPHGGPYLTRPRQQEASFNARYQPLTYDISRAGRMALAERGTLQRHVAPRTDPMQHRFMTACVTLSIRLAAERAGLDHIPLEKILQHDACPETTRGAKNPLLIRLSGKALIPDDLFGLGYPTGPKRTFRFFALEVDRGTESLDRSDPSQTSYGSKLPIYLELMRRLAFTERWGIPNLLVLTVTSGPTRMRNMVGHLAQLTEHEPKLRARFLFKCKPAFTGQWTVPSILHGLLNEPWQRAECEPIQIDAI
jgi:hypothetical protein